jgi:hypothetical protein
MHKNIVAMSYLTAPFLISFIPHLRTGNAVA